MTTKAKILLLGRKITQYSNVQDKQKIQDSAKKLCDQMYQDAGKVREIESWLRKNWPDHERADEGLAKYEQLCDEFKDTHGMYEHELPGVGVEWTPFTDPHQVLKNMAETWKVVDKNGQYVVDYTKAGELLLATHKPSP